MSHFLYIYAKVFNVIEYVSGTGLNTNIQYEVCIYTQTWVCILLQRVTRMTQY